MALIVVQHMKEHSFVGHRQDLFGLILLLLEMISAIEQRLFETAGDAQLGRAPVHHVEALQLGSFETCGQLMVLSLAQGGLPPNLLTPWVYRYLCTQDVSGLQLSVQDIADVEIRELVTKVTDDLPSLTCTGHNNGQSDIFCDFSHSGQGSSYILVREERLLGTIRRLPLVCSLFFLQEGLRLY